MRDIAITAAVFLIWLAAPLIAFFASRKNHGIATRIVIAIAVGLVWTLLLWGVLKLGA